MTRYLYEKIYKLFGQCEYLGDKEQTPQIIAKIKQLDNQIKFYEKHEPIITTKARLSWLDKDR